jgi:hypothetical protein
VGGQPRGDGRNALAERGVRRPFQKKSATRASASDDARLRVAEAERTPRILGQRECRPGAPDRARQGREMFERSGGGEERSGAVQ